MSAELLESFLEMLALERNAAKNTLEAYSRDLSDFSAFLSRKKKSVKTARKEEISEYIAQLDAAGLSPSTQARRLSALKQFFEFLLLDDIRDDNPALNIDAPRLGKRLPRYLSVEEVDALLRATEGKEPDQIRMAALMHVLYATGIRVSELVGLPFPVRAEDQDFLIILGKGNKERLVPINESAKKAISSYENIRTRFLPDGKFSPWLFPSRGKEGHLTRQRFGQMLKDLAVNAGLAPSQVSPHTLRHAFASHLLANGADLRSLQKMLGHSDISTTQIYTHVLEERLVRLVKDHHPLADAK
ncbi:MAG: site-specific tyrosine recombinase XerD [Sneathiellales bacterium]|nr:site-specific tyrosine recombinase XerD [Sneathiellales bacterium]